MGPKYLTVGRGSFADPCSSRAPNRYEYPSRAARDRRARVLVRSQERRFDRVRYGYGISRRKLFFVQGKVRYEYGTGGEWMGAIAEQTTLHDAQPCLDDPQP